jgi:hypothetical protein
MIAAKAQPFSAASRWAEEGWALWRRRPLLLVTAALSMLAMRWLLDLLAPAGASALIIVLSYLTDALVVACVWTALTAETGGLSPYGAWQRLAGRRLRVARAGLWGLPSAAIGFVLLLLAPTLMQSASMLLGARAAGWLMLAWVFASGYLSCVLLFAAQFATIEAARGDDTLWRTGMRGWHAALLGWRPLLAVWTAFICGAAFFAVLAANLLGHIGFDRLDGAARVWLETWINWPALFVAMCVLLAIIVPAAHDLSAAAECEATEPAMAAFGERAARRLGFALRTLAAAFGLAGFFAIDMSLGTCVLGAFGLWLIGRAVAKAAPAWGQADASAWARWGWTVHAAVPWLAAWGMWAALGL